MSSGLQEGTIFAGRYKILRRIAQGGMGAVYEVMHLDTDRRRALKVMHPHTLQSDELRERFKREAKVAAHIESDFIVEVFDAGVDDATQMPFLVMELLRGEEIGKRLKRLGRLPPEEVVLHLHQAALALDKTHKASIVHRDLKPENLFLAEREDSPPRIKVLDFGVAKIVAESATSSGPTQSLGTPLYMSPEQFNPRIKLSGASDIYALGLIAYTLLVGAAYWSEEARAGNVYAVAAVAIHGPPQPASVRAAARGVVLPPAFDPWFARMTAANPADRYPTATMAVRALADVFRVALPAAGGSLVQSGILEGVTSRPALASAVVSPPSGTIAMQAPGTIPMALSGPAVPPLSEPVPPIAGPGTTSLGASMTRPLRQDRGRGGLIAIAFVLGGVGIGGPVLYAVLSQSAPKAATPGDQAQVAPTMASTEAKLLPAMQPTAATSPPAPAASAALPAPEPSPSASVQVASKPALAPSAGVQRAPAPPPAAKAKPTKKYTPD